MIEELCLCAYPHLQKFEAETHMRWGSHEGYSKNKFDAKEIRIRLNQNCEACKRVYFEILQFLRDESLARPHTDGNNGDAKKSDCISPGERSSGGFEECVSEHSR